MQDEVAEAKSVASPVHGPCFVPAYLHRYAAHWCWCDQRDQMRDSTPL